MPNVERRVVPVETVAEVVAAELRKSKAQVGQHLARGLEELGPERLREIVADVGISEVEATSSLRLAREVGLIS